MTGDFTSCRLPQLLVLIIAFSAGNAQAQQRTVIEHSGKDVVIRVFDDSTRRWRVINAAELEQAQPISQPGPLGRFNLRVLDETISASEISAGPLSHPKGARVTSDTLAGRIAVLEFWGVWCGPCVAGLPDIQRAWQHYRADAGVVFLTIDTRDAPEAVRALMKTRGYDFPVLLDDGFADRAGVMAYPTLLVLDRSGNKLVRRRDEETYKAIVRLVEQVRIRRR